MKIIQSLNHTPYMLKRLNKLMKAQISIITSTLNCLEDVKETYYSIKSQQKTQIQWIIADGFSTDGTINFIKNIKNNKDLSIEFFSNDDNGIYDAWNNACKLIKYKWTIFLGAGDIFFNNVTLLNVWNFISTEDYPFLFYAPY